MATVSSPSSWGRREGGYRSAVVSGELRRAQVAEPWRSRPATATPPPGLPPAAAPWLAWCTANQLDPPMVEHTASRCTETGSHEEAEAPGRPLERGTDG